MTTKETGTKQEMGNQAKQKIIFKIRVSGDKQPKNRRSTKAVILKDQIQCT